MRFNQLLCFASLPSLTHGRLNAEPRLPAFKNLGKKKPPKREPWGLN